MDAETDPKLLKHIRETITSMLQALADNDLKHWLALCKQVLLASNVDDEPTPEQNTGIYLVIVSKLKLQQYFSLIDGHSMKQTPPISEQIYFITLDEM